MEQHLRIALWMAFFIGHLQAAALQRAQETRLCFNQADLNLERLGEKVTCNPNVNFTSPSNVMKPCYGAALNSFIVGLQKANGTQCTGDIWRIDNTVEALERATKTPVGPVNSPDCKWENKKFAELVEDLKTFTEKVISGGQGHC